MNKSLFALIASAIVLCASFANAQDDQKGSTKKELTISNKGITLRAVDSAAKAKSKEKDENKVFSSSVVMDLGVNFIQDKTNYADPKVQTFVARLPHQTIGLNNYSQNFDLQQSKSINVNLYWLESFRALKTAGQRIYISTGLGMQIYNFRYSNPITFTRDPSGVIHDSITFSKNKLAVNYLSVPLNVTFKTRLYSNKDDHKKDKWLVYGAGITGGYAMSVWTKQKSDERGKVKMHDQFGLSKFNSCVTAEIGIDDVIRFYASYSLTNMYDNGMDQRPFCIGLKLSGI